MRRLISFFLLFFSCTIFAGDLEVTSSVFGDRYSYATDDHIEILTVIKGEINPNDVKNFRVEDNPNYSFLGISDNQVLQSTRVEIINRERRTIREFQIKILWAVKPVRAGSISIQSPRFEYLDQTYSGNTVAVVVRDKGEDKPDVVEKRAERTVEEKPPTPEFWFRMQSSKTRPYVGEEVVLTFEFGPRVDANVGQIGIPDIQKVKTDLGSGFVVRDLFETTRDIQETASRQERNGAHYNLYTLDFVLYPVKKGDVLIGPFEIEYSVRTRVSRQNDFFSMFFDNVREETKKTSSNMWSINVLDKKVTAGDYSLTSDVSNKELNVGQPINLNIEITGKGNIRMLNIPEIETGNEFTIYSPEISYSQRKRGKSFENKATIKYLIVPRVPGNFKIPGLKIPYFNVRLNKMDTLKVSSINAEVSSQRVSLAQTEDPGHFGYDYDTQQAVRPLAVARRDIHYILTGEEKKARFFIKSKEVIGIALALIFINIILMVLVPIKKIILHIFTGSSYKKAISAVSSSKDLNSIRSALLKYITASSKMKFKGKSLEEIKYYSQSIGFEELSQLCDNIVDFEQIMYCESESSLDKTKRKNIIKLINKIEKERLWENVK